MDLVETIGQLVEYGLAFAVLAAVTWAFMTDSITSGKSRDREIARERAITDRALAQVDGLTEALSELSDAFETKNAIEEALLKRDREARA